MDITDYMPKTAFIRLPRSVFADQTYFDNLLHFLCLPSDSSVICIDVNQKCVIDGKLCKRNYHALK